VDAKQLRGTAVVFRHGNVLNPPDLIKVAAHRARAIIVLVPGSLSPDEADATALRIVLCLRGLPFHLEGHVIVALRDIDNQPLVKLVGGDTTETMVSHDLIGRLMLMSARQPGLAKVYAELIGFAGDEFYMRCWPKLVQERAEFRTLHMRMLSAIPIGVKDRDGRILLNPDPHRRMTHGDQVVVLAEDDDTYEVMDLDARALRKGQCPEQPVTAAKPETVLITGWRRDIQDMFFLLDKLVAKGTKVFMLNSVPLYKRALLLEEDGLRASSLANIEIVHHWGDAASRKSLQSLPVFTLDSVLILVDSAQENDPLRSDSSALASLLIIRSIQNASKRRWNIVKNAALLMKSGQQASPASQDERFSNIAESAQRCPIVCEILDGRTQRTIVGNPSLCGAADWMQSNKMVSQILAMVAEDRNVKVILDELLGPYGASLNIRPASAFAAPGERITFAALAQRALSGGAVLCGYQDLKRKGKVVLNPRGKLDSQCWDGVAMVVLSGEGEKKPPEKDVFACEQVQLDHHSAGRTHTLTSHFPLWLSAATRHMLPFQTPTAANGSLCFAAFVFVCTAFRAEKA
jgi:hypothetical protein